MNAGNRKRLRKADAFPPCVNSPGRDRIGRTRSPGKFLAVIRKRCYRVKCSNRDQGKTPQKETDGTSVEEPDPERAQEPLQHGRAGQPDRVVLPDRHSPADHDQVHLYPGPGRAAPCEGRPGGRLHALLLAIHDRQQHVQGRAVGAPDTLLRLRLLHHADLRASGLGAGLADDSYRPPRQEGPGHPHHRSLHDSLLDQGHRLAGGVPNAHKRRKRIPHRHGHTDSRLAGLRTHGHRAVHVHALLRILLHSGLRRSPLHQLGAGGDGRDSGSQQDPDSPLHYPAADSSLRALRPGHDRLQVHRYLRRGGQPGQPHRLLHPGHPHACVH